MGLSRLSAACQSCKYINTCNHKIMEALAYLDDEAIPISNSVLKESEMVAVTTTAIGIHTPNNGIIHLDKESFIEEINKQLHQELYLPCFRSGI